MSAHDLAIHARGLAKTFGDLRAVDGIDLDVPRGMIFAILGPNGAGKTTLMRMLATLTHPDAGTARIMGHDLAGEPQKVRAEIAMTGQFASLDEDLTGRENLVMLARLWGFRGRAARDRADHLLGVFELADAAGKQVKDYSGGMRRRLDIAASLIVTPGVLFLDEPTTGLDPVARKGVWRMIRELAGSGVTVLLTTQYLDEADQLAARIAVIDHGRKIAEGTSRELKVATGSGFLHVAVADPARLDEAAALLEARLGASVQRSVEGATLAVVARTARDANAALAALLDAGIEVADFSLGSPSLDEVFFSLTGRGARLMLQQAAKPPAPSRLSNALVFGWRAVLKFKHVPEQLFDLVMTPIMFTLLFTFVFGGALAGSPGEYLQYFVPGILVQTVMFNAVYSGMGLSTDLGKGLFDRFRSLPIWSLSPFAGLMVGDVLRHVIAGGIILTIGLLLGYRPEAGIVGVLGAFALLVTIGFGMGWIFIVLGLLIRTPMTVMTIGFTVLFPLVFASNIMVNPDTMPGWLRTFVQVNPVTLMTTAMRGLMSGAVSGAQLGQALIAPVALTLVLAPLTLWLYRRR